MIFLMQCQIQCNNNYACNKLVQFFLAVLPKPFFILIYSPPQGLLRRRPFPRRPRPDDTQDPDHVLCYSEVDCHGAELVVSLAQCCALANGGKSYEYEDEPLCYNW